VALRHVQLAAHKTVGREQVAGKGVGHGPAR
jgi:hypothetical protein